MKKIFFLLFFSLLSFKGLSAVPYLPEFADGKFWQLTKTHREPLIVDLPAPEALKDGFSLENPSKEFTDFSARGGHVHILADEFNMDPEAQWSHIFGLIPGDLLIPVCHAGQNRSQVMNLVLRDTHPEGAMVLAPHGAESGFDPHQAYSDLTHDNFFGYIHGSFDMTGNSEDDLMNQAFVRAFKVSKQKRSGSEAHSVLESPDLNNTDNFEKLADTRIKMRELMSASLWKVRKAEKHPRQIYVCFGRAAGIVARRLIESSKPEASLKTVHIISFPKWGDPISQSTGGIKDEEKSSSL